MKEEFIEIRNRTSFLPEKFGIKSRRHCIRLGITKYPIYCKGCNKKIEDKIKLFCSIKCMNKNGKSYIKEKIKQTNLKKYGVENPAQLKEIKEKTKQTNLKKYGGYPQQNESIKEKTKQANLKKYGVDHNSKNKKTIEKRKQTNLKKYGVDWGLGSKQIQNQITQTNLAKYGVENPFQSEKIKIKIKQTNLKKYGVENSQSSKIIKSKIRKTNLKKYGVENPFISKEIQQKIKQTNLKKYGVEHPSQSNKIREKTKINFYQNKILNLKIVKPLFEARDYKTIEIKYPWECLKCGNKFLDHLEDGHLPRCLKCYPYLTGTSNIEKEIQEWLLSKIQIIPNKRFFENGKYKYELDIYIPSKDIAIELDGVYYHSEINGGKNSSYHLDKTNWFLKRGIQVIHIWDTEWINKQDLIKSMILAKLGFSENKIYARKCEIKEVNPIIAKNFLDQNHLQGVVNSKIKIGLFYNDELISLLTLGKPRFNKKYEWEILRYCNKQGYNITGGFSKLLKYFIKTYQPSNILTYADKRISFGKVYENNGFELVGNSPPNYYYFNKRRILESRVKYQKHKLKDFPNYNKKLTEWEIMQLEGFDRIWDCGNLTFHLFQ